MSHCPGQVIDAQGQIVGHFEYNGTVDVALPKIYATAKERDAAWRQGQPTPCVCAGVDVTLVSEGCAWEIGTHGHVSNMASLSRDARRSTTM